MTMHVLDIAVTLNAEPIPIVLVRPSPLNAFDRGRRRLGQTTAFDLADAPVVRCCAPSRTCAT